MNQRALIVSLSVIVVILAGLNLWQARDRELSDRDVVDRFTILWMKSLDTFLKNTFLGIPTFQNPMDAWVTLEIISQVKPDVIVEAGTFMGGSAALWATFLEQVNPEGRVLTIDIGDFVKEARDLSIVKRKVDFLIGSSTSPRVLEEVKRRVEGKRVMVILDSLHTKEHVLAELRAYSSIVPVGSYIVVQDGVVNGHPAEPDFGPGPYEAVEAFLAENDGFVIDQGRERLMMTFNPNGFLRRVE